MWCEAYQIGWVGGWVSGGVVVVVVVVAHFVLQPGRFA